jgi:molybdopterin molybdotransferase
VERALVAAEAGDQKADPERGARREVREPTQQRGTEPGRGAVDVDDAGPHDELADGLPRTGVQHDRVHGGEQDREKPDDSGEHRAIAEAATTPEPPPEKHERQLDDEDQQDVDQRGDAADPEAGGTRGDDNRVVHAVYNTGMISVQDGQNHILAQVTAVAPPEVIPLVDARGRVLAGDVRAPFDVPPADNSAVDGYAVTSADLPASGMRELEVVADLPAGSVFEGTLTPGRAVRIMTGAPMPAGADTVLPQEVVKRVGVRVSIPPIAKGSNVRRRGEDVTSGMIVIERGTVLRPQEIGLVASLGARQALVRQRPRVAVLSTGDEVAEPGTPRAPGQIYDANRFTLRGLAEQCGAAVSDLGIVPDRREELRARLLDASHMADVVLTSGGVSVGAYDLVKEVLGEIGGIEFWQVAMQPGRPLAVGRIGDAHFFGLPGNPVASMLTFVLFVRPALYKLAGRRRLFPEMFPARAAEPMGKKPGRREFKRGVLRFADGCWHVRTTGPQGSGILSSMVAGNCLIVLEEDRGDVAEGETVLVEPFVQDDR